MNNNSAAGSTARVVAICQDDRSIKQIGEALGSGIQDLRTLLQPIVGEIEPGPSVPWGVCLWTSNQNELILVGEAGFNRNDSGEVSRILGSGDWYAVELEEGEGTRIERYRRAPKSSYSAA